MQWRFVLIAMLFGATPLCHAEVYKWVDDNGKVHYSDTPRDGEQKGIAAKSHTPEEKHQQQKTEQQRREKTRKLLHAIDEERRIKREKEAQAQQQQQKKERECKRARRQLANMQRGGVYYELDKEGNRNYKSDAEVKKNIAEWKSAVERWCN